MKKLKIMLVLAVFPLVCFMSNVAEGVKGLKVISATRVTTPPVIDGRLDDACWAKAEARTDFVSPAFGGEPVPQQTTMRVLFDARHLYIGLEFQWDNISLLQRGIAAIRKQAGPISDNLTTITRYVNQYGVELFLDPGASQRNYYQILFNAAGQWTGNYKSLWDAFRGGQTIKSAVCGNRWCAEVVYPYSAGIRAGDEWGLNLVRDDETCYGIWSPIDASFHEPKLFGRIVMGDYNEWWNAVWNTGAKMRLAGLEKDLPRLARQLADLTALHTAVVQRMKTVEAAAKGGSPATRDEFERRYLVYHDFLKDFNRFVSVYDQAALMETPSAPGDSQDKTEAGPTATTPDVVLKEDFEDWVWRPIVPAMMADGRKALAEGLPLGYDYKGPLYAAPKAFVNRPGGYRVQGAAAWRGGNSTRLVGPCLIGMYDRFSGLFQPGQEYRYELALKGKGTLHLRGWIGGETAAGQFKWLGYPDLIAERASGQWRVVRGHFRLPEFPKEPAFTVQSKNSAAIVLDPGEEIFLDDLIISASSPGKAP